MPGPTEAPPFAPTDRLSAPPLPVPARWIGFERRWLAALSIGSIGLLLALSAGLLWVQREATLDLAKAQAQREVTRLAAELDQSLRQARVSMAHSPPTHAGSGAQDLLGERRPLIEALSLPFGLSRLPPPADGPAARPTGQWLPGLARQEGAQAYLPLVWHQPAAEGGQTFEVRISREAVLRRFASEGMPADGSMSLFRVEDDGATTVLVRHPMIEKEQGLTLHGHVAKAAMDSTSGVFQARSVIDGVHRIVGFHRLGDGGQRLLVVYALPVEGVLAVWSATLPVVVALTLLLAGAMGYGAWRLDRSLRALRRSERHFQALSGHLPDVVARHDRQGRVLYVNAAVEAANGLRPEAMIGRRPAELGAPAAVAEAWMACLERVFDTGKPETLYFSYPGPEGLRHWEARAMLEPAMPGDPASVLVVSRDITQRQEMENHRLAAQRLFEAVFQSAPEAMSLGEWDSGRLLLVNDAFCTLFGRTRESLIGHTAVELGLWRSVAGRQQLLDALARGERVRDATGFSSRPDGQPIEVRYSAERVQVDGQDRLLLLFRDVTQLEQDQRALTRSELRFRLAAEHGQVWEWDLDTPPPSEAFYTALGYPATPPQEPPRALSALIHPRDLPVLLKTLHRFLQGRADFRLELRARDARDRCRWFEVRGSGQRNELGRVTYMAGTVFEITDRKELEAAQRQTLTQLDAVANASPALFWTTDIHKHPNWLNKARLAFTGRDLVSECDAFWLDDLHPQDRERCERVFNTAFDAREPYSMEYRMLRHDGQYRWVLEQGMPRHDADQHFIGYIGSCLDVNERQQAEATALERGAILEQVFSLLQDMLFVLDREERFVHFQAGSHDRLLLHPDEFMGRPLGELMPPQLVEQLREAMARASEGGPQELDYSLDLPAGRCHFNARLAWLPGGEQCMFFVRDTTEQQKHLQERERTSQFVLLLFRLASRFINLPVQQMDQAIQDALGDLGRFVGADRAALFSHDARTDTHVWCAEDLPAGMRHRPRPPQAPEAAGATAQGRDGMVCVSDVDALPEGEFKAALQNLGIRSLVSLPLSSDQDGGSGFVTLESVRHTHTYDGEDITLLQLFAQMLMNVQARSQAQARLRELTDQLEMKVAERTAQLEESVRRLQVVNRELESFTYSASHDLRTPLRGIEGFCSLLLEEHASQLDEQGRAYLQRIQKATLHMSQLVSDLLAYSRLQQLTEQREPVALAACVQEVVVPFRDEMEARQSRLSLQIPDDLKVQANAKGLAIVLRNLIDNALKFTPPGEAPDIRIEAQAQAGRVRLSVCDRGMGFDMKYHDRIFGMFQRLHRQDQIPGTGIGLALVHKAVERMGGHIRAESSPGQGASFHLDLPTA